MRVTLNGPLSVIENTLYYFNLLMADVPEVLTVDHMQAGPAIAARNLAKLEAKYGPMRK